MRHIFKISFVVIISFASFNLNAQTLFKNDSIIVCNTVNGFFSWYIDAIKQHKHTDFQPEFVESKNGMTTLDFTRYISNLSKYGLSDSLILKEKTSYKPCLDALGEIAYKDFNTQYTDLDHFEGIQCDFSNYYRWIGGQEAIAGVRIKTVTFNKLGYATVIIEYYDYNAAEKKNNYWGENAVSLTKIKGYWKIENINWR